ncbi:MAG: caspase family protein [Cyanobacteriota bacterium]|jgi:hypothetical protein
MTKAIALVVGLNKVDSNSSDYSDERRDGIRGSVVDANNMQLLLEKKGFDIYKLLNEQATSKSILKNINDAASSLDNGNLFVFFFSGHGDQVKDENGDENDSMDEALAAYDRRIIDDELPPLWAKFRPGVRILMISDTCNSGTIFRGQTRRSDEFTLEAPLQINASLIHLAATHDSKDTLGDPGGSVFTNALLKVWNNGSFQGDYTEFLEQIKNLTSNSVLSQEGPNVATFVRERPFTV